MRKSGRQKGSMTVFLGMTMMILLSLFFTMAESVRLQVLSGRADEISEQAVESLHSMYLDALWERYGILGFDLSLGRSNLQISEVEGKLLHYMKENGTPEREVNLISVDFVRLQSRESALDAYGLLTDGNGSPWILEAVMYEKSHVGADAMELLLDQVTDTDQGEQATVAIQTDIKKGMEALEEARRPKEEEEVPQGERIYPEGDWSGVTDPMPQAGQSIQEGALPLYIPSEKTVSSKVISTENVVSKRNLAQGNITTQSVDAVDRLIYQQYVLSEFKSYVNQDGESGLLDYQVEYILCGKDSDVENLRATIHRILACREAQNLISIMSDGTKVATAGSMATSLVGASLNPVLIEIVKLGLLASWAYGESLLDVRTLLNGGKVPLLKTPSEWTSNLATLPTCFDAHQEAKRSGTGMSYEDYLRLFLATEQQGALAYRTMDLVELTIRSIPGYEQVRMDQLLYVGSYSMSFESSPLFFCLVPEGEGFTFSRKRVKAYSYLDGWVQAVNQI